MPPVHARPVPAHTTPQPPQLLLSAPLNVRHIAVGAQLVIAGQLGQSVVPAAVHTHWLLEQVVPVGHALPQAPQFELSVGRARHVPPQSVKPAGHTQPIAPPQTLPPVHALPHPLQWFTSVAVFAHTCPVPVPQRMSPPAHASVHTLITQLCAPPAGAGTLAPRPGHWVPQPLQLRSSLVSVRHVPPQSV